MGPTSFQPAGSPMTMREQLPAVIESVAVARRAVRRFTAGLEVDVVGITLAVSEPWRTSSRTHTTTASPA
jgi:hypothetical protein